MVRYIMRDSINESWHISLSGFVPANALRIRSKTVRPWDLEWPLPTKSKQTTL